MMACPFPLRVLLVAEESAGVQLLQAVHDSRFQIAAVMATPPRDGQARGAVWSAARKRGIDLWPATLVRNIATARRIREAKVDILLNAHSLHVIPDEVLQAPRIGAFNLHPGPLPRYAGLNAVSWAIYNGEQKHGVTVHRMDPGIDTGPIVDQAMFAIESDDTALSLAGKCSRFGIPLMLKLLERAATDPGSIPLAPQDLLARQYFGRQIPNHGVIDWTAHAEQIRNLVRACDYGPFPSPWGHARTYIDGIQVEILKVAQTGRACDQPPGTVGAIGPGGALIATADEWLRVAKLRLGERTSHPADVLRTMQRLQDSP
jgi:methionyl-tRNA formyltransferase